MWQYRSVARTGIFALSAVVLAACATTHPYEGEDGGGKDPDPIADANPEDPDAAPRPDAAPVPDADIVDPPDAAVPNPPDAAVPNPPDAAVPNPPDASVPCTPTTQNLLANPAFDTGPGGGWSETATGGESIVRTGTQLPRPAHSGAYAAYLGGYNGSIFGNATDRLLQTVTIPASTTALRLKGMRWFQSEETPGSGDYDLLFLELVPSSGNGTLATFGGNPAFSNEDLTTAWTAFDLAASTIPAGQTVRISLRGTMDDQLATQFLLDTLALEATFCQ